MNQLKNVAEYFTPVLTESHFHEKGVLTPEEFVLAGDQLVYSCRTWQWSAGLPGTQKKYLPPNKQFLITRNVPSLRRAHTYALADAKEVVIESQADDPEGWLATHAKDNEDSHSSSSSSSISSSTSSSSSHPHSSTSSSSASSTSTNDLVQATSHLQISSNANAIGDIDDIDDDAAAAPVSNNNQTAPPTTQRLPSHEEDIPDMEAFDEDDNVVRPKPEEDQKNSNALPYLKAEEPEDNIVRTRTYDLSIVYDKYYRTPRVFLFGYDENRQPLTPEQIMQDISSDHANKTVTVEPHPFLNLSHASIHPCKHASVMKKIVDQMSSSTENNKNKADDKTNVKNYMFIFLKFISSVIPTIEYDFTMQV